MEIVTWTAPVLARATIRGQHQAKLAHTEPRLIPSSDPKSVLRSFERIGRDVMPQIRNI